MSFFEKKPIARLFFVLTYIVFAIWILFRDFAWLNILLSLVMLFGAYIAIAKSKIIKDKFVGGINDCLFDLYSIVLTIYLFIDMAFLSNL